MSENENYEMALNFLRSRMNQENEMATRLMKEVAVLPAYQEYKQREGAVKALFEEIKNIEDAKKANDERKAKESEKQEEKECQQDSMEA